LNIFCQYWAEKILKYQKSQIILSTVLSIQKRPNGNPGSFLLSRLGKIWLSLTPKKEEEKKVDFKRPFPFPYIFFFSLSKIKNKLFGGSRVEWK
jgi:hypothetical protein